MILVTGNAGYIGSVMTRFFMDRSYRVVGLDSMYYDGSEFLPKKVLPDRQIIKDIRDVEESDLDGVSAIIHLAALSNDPLGEINPSLTEEINFVASLRLAELAKKKGIGRFIFSSSCSMYGIASDDKPLTEEGKLHPITAYAKAKAKAEEEISRLANNEFHPVFMRNATVYGISPSLRLCLVVNNLVAWAYLTGRVAIMSDGTPWRPIIHVEDLCRAFLAALEAPVEKIRNQAINVGINDENYQIRDIGILVEKAVPNCKLEILNKTGSDERTYRVDFSKIRKSLPNFKPAWDLRRGIEELHSEYKKFGLEKKDLESAKYFRVRWIKRLLDNDKLDKNLRFKR
jgi:nucleoside-diphosphate-sugar epimerase